ncbi:CoA transferase [Dactylosporangium sp. NPDC048998]|uniref:CaiB/BaiF CoA-transferase family protein n=1 Tax=Dactylosporangium sp. NPDC048998 TaxID=3363976 RepID=UPI0037181621
MHANTAAEAAVRADALLSDLTVLEIGSRLSTAYCGRLLADLGATVVKVEAPAGDPRRVDDPAYAAYLDAGKQSVVNESPAAPVGLADIDVTTVDLVVCDDPRVAEAMRALRARSPALVVVLTTDFGSTGPYAHNPASELTLQAGAGLVAVHPHGDRPPVMVGVPLGELCAGVNTAVGALHALLSTDAGGMAIDVDVSRLESLANLIQYPWMYDQIEGHSPFVAPANPVPGIEPASDGWVCIVAVTPDQWTAFKRMSGLSELDDPRFNLANERFRHNDELTQMVRRFTTKHTVEELLALGVEFRVPVTHVATARSAANLPPFASRGSYVHNAAGGFDQPRPPFRIDGADDWTPQPAPAVGEHSRRAAPRGESRPMTPRATPERPLAGLRVVELGLFQAGPLVTQYLALLGAEVIKIESPSRPDLIRFNGGPPAAPQTWERSSAFLAPNIGKRDITVDLSSPHGLEILRRLIATSDVVVENYAPRTLTARGLDFAGIHAIRPDAVVMRMPAWGLTGPWSERAGFTYTANAMCGIADLTGYPDGAPLLSGTIIDPAAAAYGTLAVLAALRHRARKGQGHTIEMALCDVASQLSAKAVVNAGGPQPSARSGNVVDGIHHQDVYRCADSAWLAVSVPTQDRWPLVTATLGTGSASVSDALRDYCAGTRSADAVERLRGLGLPAAVVTTGADLITHPQLLSRQRVYESAHPVAGRISYIAPAARLSVQPGIPPLPHAPLFGQDNEELLRDLGFTDPEFIAQLRAEKVIAQSPFGLPLPEAAS